jgi:hypothetical protein
VNPTSAPLPCLRVACHLGPAHPMLFLPRWCQRIPQYPKQQPKLLSCDSENYAARLRPALQSVGRRWRRECLAAAWCYLGLTDLLPTIVNEFPDTGRDQLELGEGLVSRIGLLERSRVGVSGSDVVVDGADRNLHQGEDARRITFRVSIPNPVLIW